MSNASRSHSSPDIDVGLCASRMLNRIITPLWIRGLAVLMRTQLPSRRTLLFAAALLLSDGSPVSSARAQDAATAESFPREAQPAAVAMNYSRAAFHRIRRYPSKRVLIEEREQILNNLDLNGIADEETVRLYTAVLAEISDVQIADRERVLIREAFQRNLERSTFNNAWTLGTQIASHDFLNAVKTGANSWWDYRAIVWQKDLDTFKVDKSQLVGLVDKSSLFLDTFWKLIRKRGIPDRWLIRGDDLDRLEAAIREPDPETRLRVLKRMESFMECYPPYWYYVARTQQALGQLFAAAETYDRMAKLGEGHFRRDEMLASGLANRAMIQEYLHQPGAPATARDALRHATTVWEVNLVCSSVLERHGYLDEAEDGILRNLDVGLEREQSRAALAGLYIRKGDRAKLLSYLKQENVVGSLPVPLLVDAALLLKYEAIGAGVAERLAGSMACYPELRFGKDDYVVVAGPAWNLGAVQLSLKASERHYDAPKVGPHGTKNAFLEARFRGVAELGSPLKPAGLPPTLYLTVANGENEKLVLQLQSSGVLADIANEAEQSSSPLGLTLGPRMPVYRITGVGRGEVNVSFQPDRNASTLSANAP
ncbi:MAG: hypothetical protein IT428_14900 [Planctomycetaceae bacterium]|nr:hypothetical protein [Planctomycetaceae bacterium]